MRTDKPSSLRQRLRRGDAFDFDALIHGVSTLEEDAKEKNESDAAATNTVESVAEEPTDAAVAADASSPVAATPTEKHPSPPTPPSVAPNREERLRSALDSLGRHLLQETRKMAAALRNEDSTESGFYLARVNQILDLLRSIDATGDLSRSLDASNAPPEGRTWPSPSWSVVEFANSPLSGLLPPRTGEGFVREMLHSAWEAAYE